MERAVALGWTARHRVSPRPWVGAVVVPADGAPGGGSDQRTDVFVGATEGRSGPHAEVVALSRAGERARGATLFCTLEPCSHHGLTPPCADAVIEAGVARVVIAVEDPDPQVAGNGVARLRDAGIEVEVGVLADVVEAQLEPYLHHRRTGRPFVTLKLAATLDGRIAAPDGSSQWITSPDARRDAHRLRADADAIVVGAGTVRSDDPALTVRLSGWESVGDEPDASGRRQPRRIVLGEVPAGAAVLPAESYSGGLADLLADLGSRGMLEVLVEGGAGVAAAFHRGHLVDRYVLYLAPSLAGGDDGRPLFAGAGAATLTEFARGAVVDVRLVGPDLRVELRPTQRAAS